MKKRMTYSRGGEHLSPDPLDKILTASTLGISGVANFFLCYMAAFSIGTFLGIMCVFAVLIPINILWAKFTVAVGMMVRRRVFDNEQRYHEIVPSEFQEIIR